jgi:hypothetical protein
MTTLMRAMWSASPPLTAVGLLMLALTPALGLAMVLDPRAILGAPAWLKPAKFAVSTGAFCLTMAALLVCLPAWRRLRAVVGWTTAIVFVVEVAIISLQAWRGTTSHFNVATPLDGALFAVMGALIALQTLMTTAVAVALFRTTLDDRALGWAVRLGLVLSIAGASTGGLMTAPTDVQLAAARAGAPMTVAGAHTVGAPDGGPGLPGTGWSTGHGDLRVPHFLGLHALQIIPLVALLLARRGVDAARRVRFVVGATISYAALFALLLSQALRGQSVIAPDALTLAALAVWAAATIAGALLIARTGIRRDVFAGVAV